MRHPCRAWIVTGRTLEWASGQCSKRLADNGRRTMTEATRRYDKGERRYKHEWSERRPGIVISSHNPKLWVGKCPAGLPALTRERLLNEAIPAPVGDRDLKAPKAVYVVHEGAIYEAKTSDHGLTYHGYPYKGKLTNKMLNDLRNMSVAKNCADEFERWVKEHIYLHGEGR